MYCFNCGKEVNDDSKFCNHCGCDLSGKVSNQPKSFKMRCNDCGADMEITANQEIAECPFCHSKSIIIESDAVKIERIKNDSEIKKISVENKEHLKGIIILFSMCIFIVVLLFILGCVK